MIAASPRLRLEGIFSHLAMAEQKDTTITRKQIAVMEAVVAGLREKSLLVHIANSAGILCHSSASRNFSMVRTGLLLYGIMPDIDIPDTMGCEYALRGIAALSHAKDVPAGTALSYGQTYVCPKQCRIGVLALGYGDGLNRALSNNWSVQRNGWHYSVRGRICMDQTLIELRGGEHLGDEFVFLDEELRVERMARVCATVPQEILCNFGSKRMRKVYHG